MNVWMFNHHASAPGMGGSTRHFDCALRLIKRGWDVTIVAGTSKARARGDVDSTRGEMVRTQMVDGVRFLWIAVPKSSANYSQRLWSMLTYSLRARRVAKARPAGRMGIPFPNIVVGSLVHPLAAAVAGRVAKQFAVPFVLELRDLWPQSLIDMGVLSPHHPIALALRALEAWLVKHASRIIVLSERAAEYLVARGTSRELITLIPNGVDLQRFGDASSTWDVDEPFTLMYLGAHGVANRLHTILDAAARLQEQGVRDLRISFVGYGREKETLMRQARDRHLSNVEFLDGVSKEMVPHILARADALLLTEANNVYGSSNKLCDYLAAGRPIVFSTFAPHNVVPGGGLEVPPDDPAALADAMVALKRMSAEERSAMGRRGRQFVEAHRSWERLSGDYQAVLEGACEHDRLNREAT